LAPEVWKILRRARVTHRTGRCRFRKFITGPRLPAGRCRTRRESHPVIIRIGIITHTIIIRIRRFRGVEIKLVGWSGRTIAIRIGVREIGKSVSIKIEVI
jgi:hypothetical protein